MLDSQPDPGAAAHGSHPIDLRGRPTLEALRLDAGVIHRRLRRIADHTAFGGTPTVEDLDRIAQSVAELHGRILDVTRDDATASLADVVAARQSIHHSLALVQEVADEVLAD
jgi:hypothetical protein